MVLVVPLAHCFTCCKGRHISKSPEKVSCAAKHKINNAAIDLSILAGDARPRVDSKISKKKYREQAKVPAVEGSRLRVEGQCADCGKKLGTFASLANGWVALSAEERRKVYVNAAAAEAVVLRPKKVVVEKK
jgi:hypothetical protein